jgi:TPR repeat protein
MNLLVRFEFCLLLATAHAWAGPFEDGFAAYDQQKFATALELWLPLAEQGHRTAQFNVGVLYEKGLGVAPDAAAAARWYLKAAQQGDTEAQCNLGVLYETGAGVAKAVDEARKWYETVMANPSTDAGTLKIKQGARARLASLTSATEDVISYKGGRITKDAASRFDDVIVTASTRRRSR